MQTGSGAVLPVTGPEAQDEVSDEFILDDWEVAVGSVGPVTRQRQRRYSKVSEKRKRVIYRRVATR